MLNEVYFNQKFDWLTFYITLHVFVSSLDESLLFTIYILDSRLLDLTEVQLANWEFPMEDEDRRPVLQRG